MKIALILLSVLSCLPATAQNKDLAEDKELIRQAAQDLGREAEVKKPAAVPTSQPVKYERPKIEDKKFDAQFTLSPEARKSTYKSSTFTPYEMDLMGKARGKDQITVKDGWMSFSDSWKETVAKREKHKDGVLFEGPKIVDKDGETKYVVIYNVADLICDVPDFESPFESNRSPLDQMVRRFDIFAPDDGYETDREKKQREEKKKRKRSEADELEELIKKMLLDPNADVKIVRP